MPTEQEKRKIKFNESLERAAENIEK